MNRSRTTRNTVNVVYDVMDPNRIFGMVGRCGGGHNTVWSDWSERGRNSRNRIIHEFETKMNEICGHYTKLEESILDKGILDPLIITCGWPVKKNIKNVPPEILKRPPSQRFLLEGTTGGSRLWVAQKHNIPVPCIINDYTNKYNGGQKIYTVTDAIKLFHEEPIGISMSPKKGIILPFNPTKAGSHLNGEWREDQLVKYRAPMWVSLMNKYGYYVSGLNSQVNKILKDAGVEQPSYLFEKWQLKK